MLEAIGYLRVSTREQGRSGLGLAAQRREIEVFAAREGHTASGTGRCPEGREGGQVPVDCLEDRPFVSQRALHHRAYGASRAFHRCGARQGSGRLHASYLGINAVAAINAFCATQPCARLATVTNGSQASHRAYSARGGGTIAGARSEELPQLLDPCVTAPLHARASLCPP